eukprot:TRINITY_DN8010_c0_g1_i2.p1 TRINITY_DN8010_c0_g1~~TRINITY_DN8010_c0_g1_i2.p1  ORF type:complete len:633 (+),score=229.45 TRINITY_DN8010_c0_g1_i2:143-2041(+)
MARFKARTIHLVSDLDSQEQLYLYEKTRLLKRGLQPCGSPGTEAPLLPGVVPPSPAATPAGSFPTQVHLVFSGVSSTRTRDSFRDAARYLGFQARDCDAETLSGQTLTDAVNMLMGFSLGQSVFVVRSPMEGTCRWLEHSMQDFAAKTGRPAPVLINAGDGRHTHPTLEYVDVFSLIEIKRWKLSSIHIALVGDLVHGRTAHSKVDGLRVFDEVAVDLVAPPDLQYPIEYVTKMRRHGFAVRVFDSVEEYLSIQEDGAAIADIWYFCRLQFERMGDKVQGREDELHSAVAFRPDWHSRLRHGTRFLQTLPRSDEWPLVPQSFDSTPINAWDGIWRNGYWLRITLLGMLAGVYGDDFAPPDAAPRAGRDALSALSPVLAAQRAPALSFGGFSLDEAGAGGDFVEAVGSARLDDAASGLLFPVASGAVITDVGKGQPAAACWRKLHTIRSVMRWGTRQHSVSVEPRSRQRSAGCRGSMAVPGLTKAELQRPQVKQLAALAPGCRLLFVEDGKQTDSFNLHTPPRIYGFQSISCKNSLCVSCPAAGQGAPPYFGRVGFYKSSALAGPRNDAEELRRSESLHVLGDAGRDADLRERLSDDGTAASELGPDAEGNHLWVCRYCLWPHFFEDIWDAGV